MNIKSCTLIILLLAALLCSTGCFKRSVLPPDGIVKHESLSDGGIIELSGPWEFYRGSFYTGNEFNSEEAVRQREYMEYGAFLNRALPDNFRKPGYCFATYRLRIAVPQKPEEKILLRIPAYSMAVDIYCNNVHIFSNGETGRSLERSDVVKYYPVVMEAPVLNGIMELVIHASGCHLTKRSVNEPLIIGYSGTLSRYVDVTASLEMMLTGWLLIMFLYNMVLFIVLRRGRLYLFFALVCFAASMHAMVSGSSLLGRLGIQWDILQKISYLSWLGAVYFYYSFFTMMYREYSRRVISFLYSAITALCCVIILIKPGPGYYYLYYIITVLYLFSIVYFLGISLHAFTKKKKNSGLLLFSFILLVPLLFSGNYLRFSMTRFNVVGPAEIVLFCIIQSIIIGRNINVQYIKNRELTAALQKSNAELTMLNKHLELMVAEKTDELKRQNEEISQQNRKIMDMNMNLEERVRTSIKDMQQKDDMLTISARQAAMGEMLGFIGHQWKQNLYAISLYTEALKNLLNSKDEFNKKAAGESLDKIDSFVIAMFNTFNSFNNFIKPAGDAEIFSIKEAVDDTIALMHDFITINSVTVERDYKGDPVLEGLSNELEQVLMNIIKNSIDEFNERGIAERMLSISVSRNNGMNYVRIKDNAGGIKLDNPSGVFDKFRTSKKTGTGLGLYISKIIIEQRFNGKIEARNTADGAEFIIGIPFYEE